MTTPQYIPPEFQEELDLPEPGPDQRAVGKAKAALKSEALRGHTRTLAIDAAHKRVAALQAQLKQKGQSKQQIANIRKHLAQQAKYINDQSAARTASIKKQGTLQNQVYEASGEYDKLLKGDNKDAFLALKSLFGQYGLGSLAGKIYDFVKQGYGADTIGLLLQDTKEYKTRFAANDARIKAGLPVLSPADYLSTEASYRQILSSAGLPKGFYDNPADFQRWIASDVSPTEIKSRVDMAVSATSQANPAYKQALADMYGINESDLTAYFLDSKRAEPILKKQAAAGAIGAAALRRGLQVDRAEMENYATYGITADQAEQGYARIADSFESMLGLAGRYGDTWTQREAEHEVFEPGLSGSLGPFTNETADEKGKRLRSQERALFAGGQGSSVQGLNAGYSQT